ncbi:PREDICTED: RISC-loading complex subunit TARBP2 [Calidris pugnax]|uniref:RISC-loading complex subunit TARBP2 n=1 Tax=Calidris pugnax TaxID=198806 RepID=UPI00071C215B|nr:PREDICTED: RISC-loading complex subunit TARBP2 [Calidris pugnax]
MLAANPGKTPISLLQEYGTRIGKTPGYDLLKAEGQAHQPNFTFRVTVGDISCTGQGPSKKAAKHKAAEVALKLLKGGDMLEPTAPQEPSPPCFGDTYPRFENNYPYFGHNPPHFGRSRTPFGGNTPALPGPPQFCPPLQELVVQKGWRLPEYTVTQESGPAHRKEFTMTCRVERFVEIGSGTSKKLAKRNAAAKMLVRIHNVPMEPREGSEAEGEEEQFSMAGPRLEGLRGRAPGCTWDSLRNSAGEKMLQLRSHPLAPMGAGACALLQELSQEQSFAISYLDIGGCSPPCTPTSLSTPPATWVPQTPAQGGLGCPNTRLRAGPRLEGLRGRAPGCTWDSLRNSAGEKMLQLRSHPLAPMGAGACALLQELSQEQSFAISYLDIGGDIPTVSPTKSDGQTVSPQ